MKKINIDNTVRNDFDHEQNYQDLFFIKRNLGFVLINYRSLKKNIRFIQIFIIFFISNLMRAPRFLHKISLHITLRYDFYGEK